MNNIYCICVYVPVCVCVYNLKNNTCVSATLFSDDVYPQVATFSIFVLLAYIPYNSNIHVMYIYM